MTKISELSKEVVSVLIKDIVGEVENVYIFGEIGDENSHQTIYFVVRDKNGINSTDVICSMYDTLIDKYDSEWAASIIILIYEVQEFNIEYEKMSVDSRPNLIWKKR